MLQDRATSADASIANLMRDQRTDLYTPLLVGMWLDAVSMGTIVILAVQWFTTARRTDNAWTRALVMFQLAICSLATTLMVLQVNYYFVYGFGDYLSSLRVTYIRLLPSLAAFSRFATAIYLTVRAWRLHKKAVWLFVAQTPLCLAGLGGGLLASIVMTNNDLNIGTMIVAPLCEAVSDVVITVALYTGLRKRKTGWQNTDALLRRLMQLVVETQLPPALLAICVLATSIVERGTSPAYFVFYPKVHIICLILVINSRVGMAQRAAGGPGFHVAAAHISGAQPRPYTHSAAPHVPTDEVHMGLPHASTARLVAKTSFPRGTAKLHAEGMEEEATAGVGYGPGSPAVARVALV